MSDTRHGTAAGHRTRRSPGVSRPLHNLLVTGGCGFIGANFINSFMVSHPDVHVWNIDKMDYCASASAIEHHDDPHYHFVLGDITNKTCVLSLLHAGDIDTIVHFAAQSHVDNSFDDGVSFTVNNVLGTQILLECAMAYGKIGKIIHASTDEVYGEVTTSQRESDMLNPTNPYAASKAAAELIVNSYRVSFGLPIIITRGNNVYGPYQYPEKLIPRFIMLAHSGRPLTIHGTGQNTRTFIHVKDFTRALELLVDKGVIGETYNIGTRNELRVLDIARRVIAAIKGPQALATEELFHKHLIFVDDRCYNDKRYIINSDKLAALGWRPEVNFEEGFAHTVMWYRWALDEGFWKDLRFEVPDSPTLTLPIPNAVQKAVEEQVGGWCTASFPSAQ